MYQKLKKVLSFFLIIAILFSFTFRVPFVSLFTGVSAEKAEFYNIVSVIVDETSYSSIKSELDRYAKDIQGVLENTKVVILPTPNSSSTFEIASLNESLYFEGYKSLDNVDFESKLIGTVLVGDIPIPLVSNKNATGKSIVPYTDFEDKSYVYSHESKRFEMSDLYVGSIKSEIWHGVISPNASGSSNNISALKDYFDKNHDFYAGTGKFKFSERVINGNKNVGVPSDYEPYVFYFDQFREQKALDNSGYEAYEAYVKNREDLKYSRYTSELAADIEGIVLGTQNESIRDLVSKLDTGIDLDSFSNGNDYTDVPDFQSRHVSNEVSKKFIEVFNSSLLGEIRKNVHNAGRYSGTGTDVNVDFIPYFVSLLDIAADEITVTLNNDLEGRIDDIVEDGLMSKIAIPTIFKESSTEIDVLSLCYNADGSIIPNCNGGSASNDNCDEEYTNYFYGLHAGNVEKAADCSIYRGSLESGGQIVEANRGYSIDNITPDLEKCTQAQTMGFWGGNSPLNFNSSTFSTGSSLKLNQHFLNLAIDPLYDIKGSIEDNVEANTASPLNCLENGFIYTIESGGELFGGDGIDGGCSAGTALPVNGHPASNWGCGSINKRWYFDKDFEENYRTFGSGVGACEIKKMLLNGEVIKSSGGSFAGAETCLEGIKYIQHNYKTIDSILTHKSPTSGQLRDQLDSHFTPALGVDRDRYVAFLNPGLVEKEILYPNFFRDITEVSDVTDMKAIIKTKLDALSAEINEIIRNGDPKNLTGLKKELYEQYLNSGEYPVDNVDLYAFLETMPDGTYTNHGDAKAVSYLDTASFGLFWKNLSNTSLKYKFILENYLSDEFSALTDKYHLPQNKKSYEIAYLGAPGDGKNMFIKMDPYDNEENIYADTISENLELDSQLLSSTLTTSNISDVLNEGDFKCAPPEGVPLWEWLPAIICWLKDMLPPKISISEGSCGDSSLFDKDEMEDLKSCNGDFDKNGINDCIEGSLESGSMELLTDSERYYYNGPGELNVTLTDSDGDIIKHDSVSYVNFEVTRVEAQADLSEPLTEENEVVVFDISKPNEKSKEEIGNFINLDNTKIVVSKGKVTYNFSGKNKDANVYVRAFMEVNDATGVRKVYLESSEAIIKIRGDRNFLTSYKLENGETGLDYSGFGNTLSASSEQNIFLIDSARKTNEETKNIINDSNESVEKLVLSMSSYDRLGSDLKLTYPLIVNLLDFEGNIVNTKEVLDEQMSSYLGLFAIDTAGIYKIEIFDGIGVRTTKRITVLPDVPDSMEITLGSNIIESGGGVTTNFITILDKYGNPASGGLYKVELELDGETLDFEQTGNKEYSFTTFEGYKPFKLKSSLGTGVNNLKATLKTNNGNTILEKSTSIRVIEDISIEITPESGEIKVGGSRYGFDVALKDEEGNILTDLNSRIYLVIDPIYGSTAGNYSDIINGEARVELSTSTTAGENIPIEFQVEGLSDIFEGVITINPDLPVKLDLLLSQSKIEASPDAFSHLSIELKDRYGNLVFNDNSTKFSIELLNQYQEVISFGKKRFTAKNGKGKVKIYGKDTPGTAYFKVKTLPSLSKNSFTISGQAPFTKSRINGIPGMRKDGVLTDLGKRFFYESGSDTYMFNNSNLTALTNSSEYEGLSPNAQEGLSNLWNNTNTLEIKGVGENVGKIETFFFMDSNTDFGNSYNSIYTTMIGANYGDFSQEDYLAGGILFNRDNRSLSVTSLLNNPYKYSDVANITEKGRIDFVYKSRDLSQDIESKVAFDQNGTMYVDLYNDALSNLIGKVYYNFDNDVELKSCVGTSYNFDDCNVSVEKSSILLRGLDNSYGAYFADDKLVLKNSYGQNVLEITEDGKIEKKGPVDIELLDSNYGDYMLMKIKSSSRDIGLIGFKFVDSEVVVTRDQGILNQKLSSVENSIIFYLQTDAYGTRDLFDSSDSGLTGKIIYYNDPFSSKYVLDDFSSSDSYGYENFAKEGGIGWKLGNKTLLGFAAGKSVGDATKDYQSFSLINLGDPVVSLKKIKKKLPGTDTDRNFDSTIGKRLTTDEDIFSYQIFDYNNDSREDILVIKRDGYVKLFENNDVEDRYLDKGNLVNIADKGNLALVQAGDFTGDGYDDIFFVDDDGDPYLYNNIEKDFNRYDLTSVFDLEGNILRIQVFDMDDDSIDDIITLDESGQISVFYGVGGTSENPSFSKSTIGSAHGITMSSEPRTDGGAVYYDGLYQLAEEGDLSRLLTSNEEVMAKFKAGAGNTADMGEQGNIPDNLVDSMIFIKLPYDSNNQTTATSSGSFEDIVQSIGKGSESEISDSYPNAQLDLLDFYGSYGDNISYNNVGRSTSNTTFIKSEYSAVSDLSVSKVYTDRNGGTLKSGDIIEVVISLENQSNSTLRNVAVVDNPGQIFKIQHDSIDISGGGDEAIAKNGLPGYELLISPITIPAGSTATVRYIVKTLPIQHSFLKVGLYEEGEVGDDLYGDVVVQKDEKNCGTDNLIYRSTGPRGYEKGIKDVSCDASKLQLPEELKKNNIDEDNNGIPDYIDELLASGQGNTAAIEQYANESLGKINRDSDNDGIPDSHDDTPGTDSSTQGLMDSINSINDNVDSLSDSLDTLLGGLCNGFGGGGCISAPLNWAPLAPGSSPVAFGMPLSVPHQFTGIPVFSAFTFCGPHSPPTWPPCPVGAGGIFGVAPGPFRLFVTPTITGAVGTAVCLGNNVTPLFRYPPGLYPIVSGGNCIVAAAPLLGCSGDGSDGDPSILGEPELNGGSGDTAFGVLNGNCGVSDEAGDLLSSHLLEDELVKDYIRYKETGKESPSLTDAIKDAFSKIADNRDTSGIQLDDVLNRPLLSFNEGGAGSDVSMEVDFASLKEGNFQDVIKISQTRIFSFPDFVMNWVVRQIEEIANKLTDWPSLIIIIPDFSDIMNYGWGDLPDKISDSYNKGKDEGLNEEAQLQSKIDTLKSSSSELDCYGNDSSLCYMNKLNETKLRGKKTLGGFKEISGIREAYDFLGNIPFISIHPEVVNIYIPWIDKASIDRAMISWRASLAQYQEEIFRASKSWSGGETCNYEDEGAQAQCEASNSLRSKVSVDTNKLIGSIEKNIEVIESYKEFPEDLMKLIAMKEVYLEQILCNIDSISTLTGEWIGKNGKRFKAWVELFILIKAILKSWQLLIDVFTEYEQSCHECKNERYDLEYWVWKLISMIVPDIPVIQFPKWPDIILDLHNIRVGLNIHLPDLNFNPRPIILPNLPDLSLPDLPSLNFSFPEIPILPEIEIPELPDLPSLPRIELPDLPPPPTLPKLLGSLEGILNILKLITKVMCIFRTSPFAPEWIAGEKIAFMTERTGYFSLDFLDVSLPQFSFPFVDAIKVSTLVNLEFDTEFIVELARQSMMPLNVFSNDIVNKLDIRASDVDLDEFVPNSIDIDIGAGVIDPSNQKESLGVISLLLAKKLKDLIVYVDESKHVTVSNKEFLSIVNNALSSDVFTKDNRTEEIRKLWKTVNDYTYSSEDKKIEELKENNENKFNTLKEIISTEIIENKELKEKMKGVQDKSYVESVSIETNTRFEEYNQKLTSANISFVESALNLVVGENKQKTELKKLGNEVTTRVKSGLEAYAKGFKTPESLSKQTSKSSSKSTTNTSSYDEKSLLAVAGTAANGAVESCAGIDGSAYEFNYEGIYVLEGGTSYRLFDYLDELGGKEEMKLLDFDNDGDDDIIYMVAYEIFIKENLELKTTKTYVSSPPITLDSGDNKFFNRDYFIESVNYLSESYLNPSSINLTFDAHSDVTVDNYRLEYYQIIDKASDLANSDFIPSGIKRRVVDAFSDIENITLWEENENYTIRNNLAYIDYIGTAPSAKLKTKEFKNIKYDLGSGNIVKISNMTSLYTGESSATIDFIRSEGLDNELSVESLFIPRHSNIEFEEHVKIVGINGDLFVETNKEIFLYGENIRTYKGMPLLPDSRISVPNNELQERALNESSHIDIVYYDGSFLGIDLRKTEQYDIYDLGVKSRNYLITTEEENDFYYAKIRAFKADTMGTFSKQILLSPQDQSDTIAPELNLDAGIKIPVYQLEVFDFTPYLYEDSGIKEMAEAYIDFDLEEDSNGDGNNKNDEDIIINFSSSKMTVVLGEYDDIFKKTVGVTMKDKNGNLGYEEISFEVYSPIPEILAVSDSQIVGNINESLTGEPISIFRLRGNSISKLQDVEKGDTVDTQEGGFIFNIFERTSGLTLTNSGQNIASISEDTGHIDLINPLAKIKVYASNEEGNDSIYPRVDVLFRGEPIYSQYIQLTSPLEISMVDNFSYLEISGIYVKLLDRTKYDYFKVDNNASFNPGAVGIYRKTSPTQQALFSIFTDGKINTNNEFYQLEYDTHAGYSMIKLIDKHFNRTVAEVLFNVEGGFIIK